MQTIRIYNRDGKLVAMQSGPVNRIIEDDLQEAFPEGRYLWLR